MGSVLWSCKLTRVVACIILQKVKEACQSMPGRTWNAEERWARSYVSSLCSSCFYKSACVWILRNLCRYKLKGYVAFHIESCPCRLFRSSSHWNMCWIMVSWNHRVWVIPRSKMEELVQALYRIPVTVSITVEFWRPLYKYVCIFTVPAFLVSNPMCTAWNERINQQAIFSQLVPCPIPWSFDYELLNACLLCVVVCRLKQWPLCAFLQHLQLGVVSSLLGILIAYLDFLFSIRFWDLSSRNLAILQGICLS